MKQSPSGRYIASADALKNGELIPLGAPLSQHGYVMATARDMDKDRAEAALIEKMALAERLYA